MNVLTICPCCSSPMLHHFGHHREYWFCRTCWQEMPDMEAIRQQSHRSHKLVNLSVGLAQLSQPLPV